MDRDMLKIGIYEGEDFGWMLSDYSDVMSVLTSIQINIVNISWKWYITRYSPLNGVLIRLHRH